MVRTKVEVEITGKDKASPAMKGIGTSMKSMSRQARTAGIAMVAFGAALAGAMALAVKSTAKAGDEVAKMAIRTGFTTEALSELRHAAELSGTSLDGLEKASRFLSRAIVQAGDGLATYVRALARVGLSYESLMGLSPEEQFLTVLEALAGVEDETIRVAAASELLGGRMGTQMLPMLENGVEGLKDMREEAHKLGLVFSQEDANAARDFNDALTRLKGGATGIIKTVGISLMPIIEDFAEQVTEVTTGVRDWIKENEGLFNVLVKVGIPLSAVLIGLGTFLMIYPGLVTGWVLLTGAIKGTTTAIWGFKAALWEIFILLTGFALLIYGIIALWRSLKGEVMEHNFFDQLAKDIASVSGWMTDLMPAAEGAAGATAALGTEAQRTAASINKETAALKRLANELEEAWGKDRKILLGGGLAFTPEEFIRWGGEERMSQIARGEASFQFGGIVQGTPGQAVPIMAHAGEMIISNDDNAVPLENIITIVNVLDGAVLSRSVSRHLGEAYMQRNRMGG